jgi:hypothetical protein
VVVFCPREHLLAVVCKDGILVVQGRERPGWQLRRTGWAPLVRIGEELKAAESLPEPVQMVCAKCGFVGYELAAAEVPARGQVVARRADPRGLVH